MFSETAIMLISQMRKLRLKEAKWLAQSLTESQGWAKAVTPGASPTPQSRATCALSLTPLWPMLLLPTKQTRRSENLWVYFHLCFSAFSPYSFFHLQENVSCWSPEKDFKVEKEELKDGGRSEGRRKEEKKGRRKEVGPCHTAQSFHMGFIQFS